MTDLNKLRSEFEAWFTTTDVYKRICHQIEMCGSGRHQDIFTVFQRDDWREENYAQVSVMASWLAWQEKAKAQAVPETHTPNVTLTCAELKEAFDFGAPDGEKDQFQMETEMLIKWLDDGYDGAGYYCWYADLPEEGCIKLGESESGAEG